MTDHSTRPDQHSVQQEGPPSSHLLLVLRALIDPPDRWLTSRQIAARIDAIRQGRPDLPSVNRRTIRKHLSGLLAREVVEVVSFFPGCFYRARRPLRISPEMRDAALASGLPLDPGDQCSVTDAVGPHATV